MSANADSIGKHKAAGSRTRSSATLSTVLIIGLCLGFMTSQKLYLIKEEQKLSSPNPILDNTRIQDASKVIRKREPGNTNEKKAATLMPTNNKLDDSELKRILQTVAPNGEVMIVISNINLIHSESLLLWLETAKRIPSKNWLVVAIDSELRDYCQSLGINHYYRPVTIPKSQEGTGDNHAISAMKYEIIEEFLQLGWDVLLSDVDIVIVQDPLQNLYRDHDVEGMSDGFDENSAYGEIYGVDDPSMGWSRYAQGIRHMALNSGLFYLKSNERTIQLMQRIAQRLHKEKAWDQSVYNEEIFFLSHGNNAQRSQVSVRVMEIDKFVNSKRLFKFIRHMNKSAQPRPVMVHMNYHPDKTERMKAAIKYYLEGDTHALDKFPGGSEPGS